MKTRAGTQTGRGLGLGSSGQKAPNRGGKRGSFTAVSYPKN